MQADLVGAVFHPGGRMYGGAYSHHRFYGGLQRLCGEPVQSVARSIIVALYVLKRGEAYPTGHRDASPRAASSRWRGGLR